MKRFALVAAGICLAMPAFSIAAERVGRSLEVIENESNQRRAALIAEMIRAETRVDRRIAMAGLEGGFSGDPKLVADLLSILEKTLDQHGSARTKDETRLAVLELLTGTDNSAWTQALAKRAAIVEQKYRAANQSPTPEEAKWLAVFSRRIASALGGASIFGTVQDRYDGREGATDVDVFLCPAAGSDLAFAARVRELTETLAARGFGRVRLQRTTNAEMAQEGVQAGPIAVIYDKDKIELPDAKRIAKVFDTDDMPGVEIRLNQGKRTLWYVSVYVCPTTIETRSDGRSVTVSEDGVTLQLRKFNQGFYARGNVTVDQFVKDNATALAAAGYSRSVLTVLRAVSQNEGRIDGVASWDNAHLSLGFLRWNLGVASRPGNLVGLLARLKSRDPDGFRRLFEAHGLDIEMTGTRTGYLVLDGQVVKSGDRKDGFRTPEWIYRFWRGGQDPNMGIAQISLAAEMLDQILSSPRFQVHGRDVGAWLTSEYGVALIFDYAIQRPAYARKALSIAISDAGLVKADPAVLSDANERMIIARFLQLRAKTGASPPPDALRRAQRIRVLLYSGKLSPKRGSFKR